MNTIVTKGRRLFKNRKTLAVLLLLAGSLPRQANGSTADALYQQGEFAKAEQAYAEELSRKPDNARLLFNQGVARYRNKQWQEAQDSFDKAIAATDDLDLQADIYYNRGNSRFRMAQGMLQQNPDAAMKILDNALEDYKGALALHPGDEDATHNLELVQKLLDQLKKQQQEQQKKNQQNQKDKQQNPENADESKEKPQEGDQQQDQKKQQGENGNDQQKQEQNSSSESDKDKQQQNRQNPGQSGEDEQDNQKEGGSGGQENSEQQPNKDQGGKQQEQQKNNANKKHENKGKENKPQEENKQNAAQPQAGENQEQDGERKNANGSAMSMAAREDQQRRQEGRMTREEALNLLEGLQAEEGRLNFVPQGSGGAKDKILNDW